MISRRSIAFDGSLATLFAVTAFFEASVHLDDGYRGSAPAMLAGVVAAIGALPVAIRRVRPAGAFALGVVLGLLPHLLVDYDPVFVGGAVALVVAAEAVGRYGERPRSAWVLLLVVPGLAAVAAVVPGFAADAAVVAVLVAAGWALGVAIRALLQRRAALRRELEALAESEQLLSDRAIADERTRSRVSSTTSSRIA